MNRGQTSIEFIFIILVIVLYLITVTQPLINSTQGLLEDIDTVSRTNNETIKLVNVMNKLALLAEGSKETIEVFPPENGKLGCYADGNIGFIANINLRQINGNSVNPQVGLCPQNMCDKNFQVPNGITIDCKFKEPQSGQRKFVLTKRSGDTIEITSGS